MLGMDHGCHAGYGPWVSCWVWYTGGYGTLVGMAHWWVGHTVGMGTRWVWAHGGFKRVYADRVGLSGFMLIGEGLGWV